MRSMLLSWRTCALVVAIMTICRGASAAGPSDASTARSTERLTTVTLLHFSDYHSHAVPFWNEHRAHQAGIARAIGYLEREKSRGALVFSGGDMMNHGSPAWSDKYQCAEWSWMNGIVDAMAFGNHDADYGSERFAACRAGVTYPILSANTVDASGQRLLLDRGKPYSIFRRGSIRIGVFALAGRDFETLVKPANRPAPGALFTDPVAAAREVVRTLRDEEQVDAVVLIGHEQLDDDFALARQVTGIDLIFGTHSHLKRELTRIPGTSTWFISPFQYLTWISRVEMTFRGRRLERLSGRLVRMAPPVAPHGPTARRVRSMERALERDPSFAPLFKPLGRAPEEVSNEGQLERDSPLGDLVTDVMRKAAGADVAMITSSSFRQSIPPGRILVETLRASMPYENAVLVYSMPGEVLQSLIAYSVAHHGTDAFCQLSGAVVRGSVTSPVVAVGGVPLDPARTYRVAVTDFQALVADGYRQIFATLTKEGTTLEVRETFRRYIVEKGTIRATRDGRISLTSPRSAAATPSPRSAAAPVLRSGRAMPPPGRAGGDSAAHPAQHTAHSTPGAQTEVSVLQIAATLECRRARASR
jgi:5'-nucleotidase/UDP-sugar diphosphatase